MSASASRRSSTSDPPVSSPLARAPKFSPPSSRTVSPIRRALHERSNSTTNQYTGPTIRVVEEEPGTDVYSKNPFPSQPSQILPPRKAPGYTFERRGSRVSDTVAKFEASQTLVPKPLQTRKARHSTSTTTSDADTIVASALSPSSSRFSQGSTTRSSPPPESLFRSEKGFGVLQEVLPPQKPTIRAVTPSTSSSAEEPPAEVSGPIYSEDHALTPRASAASLASTSSAESATKHKANHNRGSSNISFSPSLAKRHKHSPSSGSDKKKQASSDNTAPQWPTPKGSNSRPASSHSFAYTDYSYNSDRPRSASHPVPTIHEARTATVASGVQVNYPTVRAPSASSLWAQSQDQLPPISSRMNSLNDRDSQVHHWSSQLSTIPSESERTSRSIGRTSHSFSARSQSQDDYAGSGRAFVPCRRRTVSSISSSEYVSSTPTESSVPIPLPLFSPISPISPITHPSHDHESDEGQDTISPLQSPPLRMKNSFLRRWDSDSRSTSSSSRPSSSQSDLASFVASTIPAWARVYYQRGERSSLVAPASESSTSLRLPSAQSGRSGTPSDGHLYPGIYRPRNRPHQRVSHAGTVLSDGPIEQEAYIIGPSRRTITEPLTPRLRQDRRSQAQLSAWKAPSFDENLGSMLFSRQNRQIVLFCVGFIFPLAWMIASILPLPPDPDMARETTSALDLERRFADQFGPVVDKSYQKANWWRNLNRIMSGIGTLLIGVIIALAILASRMS